MRYRLSWTLMIVAALACQRAAAQDRPPREQENPPPNRPDMPPPGERPNIFDEVPGRPGMPGRENPGRDRGAQLYGPPTAQQARLKLRDAQAELARAQAAFGRVGSELRSEFEAGEEMKSVHADLKQATSDLEAARKPILDALRAKPEYQAALAKKREADTDLEHLRSTGGSTEAIYEAATKGLEAGSAINKMESQAMAADPKCADARKRIVEATAKIAAKRKEFEGSVKESPKYLDAKRAVEDAQARVKTATADLRDAGAKDAESDRLRREQMEERERRNLNDAQRDPNLRDPRDPRRPPAW